VPPPLVLPLLPPLSLVVPVTPFPAPLAVLATSIPVNAVPLPAGLALMVVAPVPMPVAAIAVVPAVPAAVGVCLPVRRPVLPPTVAVVTISVIPGVCLPVSARVGAVTGTLTTITTILIIPTAGAAVVVPIAVSALPVALRRPVIVASLPAQFKTKGRKCSINVRRELRRRVLQLPVDLRSGPRWGENTRCLTHANFQQSLGLDVTRRVFSAWRTKGRRDHTGSDIRAKRLLKRVVPKTLPVLSLWGYM